MFTFIKTKLSNTDTIIFKYLHQKRRKEPYNTRVMQGPEMNLDIFLTSLHLYLLIHW